MDHSLPAVERIAFQHKSQLADKVVVICQEFLDWIAETRKLRVTDGVLPPITTGRMKAAMQYAKDVFGPALAKVFLAETNLHVLVAVYGDLHIDCFMAPLFTNLSTPQIRQVYKTFSGIGDPQNPAFDPAIFDTIDAKVDLTSSKLTTISKEYVMLLGILPAEYLGEEVFEHFIPVTAEEYAAGLLHELGHALTVLEYVADTYHRADVAGNSIKYLNEKADDRTCVTTLETVKEKTRDERDPEWSKFFSEITPETKQSSGPVKSIGVLTAMLAARYLCIAFTKVFRASLARITLSGSYGSINSDIGKTSDTTISESNASYKERIADEFVSRHGLGGPLISWMAKFEAMKDKLSTKTELAERLKTNYRVTWALITAYESVYKKFGMLMDVNDGTYDPPWLRLEHLIRNNMVVFKDESLSDELREFYLGETTKMLKVVESYKSTNRFKLTQLFWGTLLRITSRGSLLDSLRTAGLSADYDRLQLMSNGLVKNPLAFHAARLQSLLR